MTDIMKLVREKLDYEKDGDQVVIGLGKAIQFRLTGKYFPNKEALGDDIIKMVASTVHEIIDAPDTILDHYCHTPYGEKTVMELQKELNALGFES